VDLDEQSVVAIAVALPVVLFAAYLIGQHNAPRESITEMISQGSPIDSNSSPVRGGICTRGSGTSGSRW